MNLHVKHDSENETFYAINDGQNPLCSTRRWATKSRLQAPSSPRSKGTRDRERDHATPIPQVRFC